MAKWSLRELFWQSDDVELADSQSNPNTQVQPTQPAVASLLRPLRDVQGVVGSLAIGLDGSVWAHDLPPTFDDDSTARLALRLAQLHEALTSEGDQFDAGALRYQAYRFHVARALPGLLGVLTQDQVNLPALAMGMKLVSRKLASLGAQGDSADANAVQTQRANAREPGVPA